MKQLCPSLRTGLHSRSVRLTWAAVLVWITALVVFYPVAGAKNFSDWSIPVKLSLMVNSEFEGFSPEMAKNSLSLYVASAQWDWGLFSNWTKNNVFKTYNTEVREASIQIQCYRVQRRCQSPPLSIT